MILQRGVADPVWGWTTPGAKVVVNIAGKNATATADKNGKWMAKLPAFPQKGPFGPFTLAITGPQNVKLENVMFGDVWVCSGQSNMQMGIGNVNNAATEIAAANYPNIRLITVPDVPALKPVDTFSGKWDVCTPDTVAPRGRLERFQRRRVLLRADAESRTECADWPDSHFLGRHDCRGVG